MSLDVVRQVGSGQIFNISCWPKDCTAERAVLKRSGVKVIEEHLLHLLLNLKSTRRQILKGEQPASAKCFFTAIEVDRWSGLQPEAVAS